MEIAIIISVSMALIVIVGVLGIVGLYLARKKEERKIQEALRELRESIIDGWNDDISLKGD